MDYERALALATLWQEARGASHAEQDLVAQVIHNRMLHHFFSDGTVVDTVTRPYQFSGWLDRNIVRESLRFVLQDSPLLDAMITAWHLGAPAYPNMVQYYSPQSMSDPNTPPYWAVGKTPVLVTPSFRFFSLAQMIR